MTTTTRTDGLLASSTAGWLAKQTLTLRCSCCAWTWTVAGNRERGHLAGRLKQVSGARGSPNVHRDNPLDGLVRQPDPELLQCPRGCHVDEHGAPVRGRDVVA